MPNVQLIRDRLNHAAGVRNRIMQEITDLTEASKTGESTLKDIEEAQKVIQVVGAATQNEVSTSINELVTAALQSIFPNPYELDASFVQRRGTTELDCLLKRDGHSIDSGSAGEGVSDVIALALRPMLLTMHINEYRKIIVFDEPLKFLKPIHHPIAAQFIKQLYTKTKFQIIMVTHSDALAKAANKVFNVEMIDTISTVTSSADIIRKPKIKRTPKISK